MWAVEIQTIPASAEDSEAPLRATGCLLYGSPSKLLHGDSVSTSQRALCQTGPERAIRCQGDIILPCLKCGTSVSCEQSIAERNCTTM